MIADVKKTEGVGSNVLKKTIHAGSESIMFSVLQETQYVYPVKSSVREVVSNSLDSVTERINALKILRGEIKVEDLFVTKEGDEFKESKFDKDYYNKEWLSDDNEITIHYIENDSATRDRIKFIDNGVGLGGNRLVNYFSLGFSTKRLSKNQLGSFGLGAKSLLATGVDFYTMTTRYNGMEFRFNIFKDHVASDLSKFNEDSEIVNKEFTFYNGYKAFYRPTKKKNGVTVEAEVKRFKKAEFISSIENQLGYIPNIKLLVSDAEYGGQPTERPFAHEVIYQNDKLIVGSYSSYSVPQILLTPGADSPVRISYGTINFEELEMKKYSGNVSFIMNINDVDVTPSRESVVWNNKTREAIKNCFLAAQKTITDIIDDKMKDMDNLPDYLHTLANFRSNSGQIDGMSELYKIVDASSIKTTYKGFSLTQAATQMTDDNTKKNVIFTNTGSSSIGHYNSTRKINDTSYKSGLSREYIARMSQFATEKPVVYVGKVKYKGIGRYVRDKYKMTEDTSTSVIFIDEEYYTELVKRIGKQSIDEFVNPLYAKGAHRDVLLGEICRFMELNPTRVLLEKDIDKTKMNSLKEKEEEKEAEVAKTRYMTEAERAKVENKVTGNKHNYGSNTYRCYYNEDSIITDNVYGKIYVYNMSDTLNQAIVREFSDTLPDNIAVIGFSEDNFRRFYNLDGVSLLTDGLYRIEFGELSFTELGFRVLGDSIRRKISDCFGSSEGILAGSVLEELLEGNFRDFSKDSIDLESEINYRVRDMEREAARAKSRAKKQVLNRG